MSGTFIEVIKHSEQKKELWQWDTGRQIKITPKENAIVDEVHFSNSYSKDALVVKPQVTTQGNIVADIPNILLWQVFPINVYVVMEFPNGKGTIYEEQLKINPRKKPSDYVYTETEVLTYKALEKRIKELEENDTSDEQIKKVIEEYLKDNPIEKGATPEQAKKIEKNEQDITTLTKDKLDSSKLPEAINTALAQAKESGQFDGKDGVDGVNGKDGLDGYTPVKGVDYFDGINGKDGYTPIKGVDYFDGQNGKDGEDGKTPQKGVDYFTEADKTDFVNSVIEALPKYDGEVITL